MGYTLFQHTTFQYPVTIFLNHLNLNLYFFLQVYFVYLPSNFVKIINYLNFAIKYFYYYLCDFTNQYVLL